jgi:GDP-L-fucose synthase
MRKDEKIFITGHTGLIGSALLCKLKEEGYSNLLFRTRNELDLGHEKVVADFFEIEKPDYVFLAAGKSGGIFANSNFPAELIYENIRIESNVIHYAYKVGVKKLLYIGCSCLYPQNCPQPMKEDYLLTGLFEPTNEMFSIAKLTGLKLCQAYNRQYNTNFICCITENLFGPNDKFDSKWGHVIPALIEKFHKAKIKKNDNIVVWGTGEPKRSFVYIEDAADALIFLMENYNSTEYINIGANLEISIAELASLIKNIVGFEGEIIFDASKPNGMPRKILDIERFLRLGWRPQFSLTQGIKKTYDWYLRNKVKVYNEGNNY